MKAVAASHFLWAGLALGVRLELFDYLFLPCLSGYHPHPLYVVCTHFPE